MNMNKDFYGEIINGAKTYNIIAEHLIQGDNVIIGWTEGATEHRDILFSCKPYKYGTLQGGLHHAVLFVSMMTYSCSGFLIKDGCNNWKHPSYIKEKLQLSDNYCDDKICELINGVIREMDLRYGNTKENDYDEE